jgi:hypothetical protein
LNVFDLTMGVTSEKLTIFWLYGFDIQQDEDKEDPDERHDPDYDMKIDGRKPVATCGRVDKVSLSA